MFLPSNPFSDRFVTRRDPGQRLKPYSYVHEKALYTIVRCPFSPCRGSRFLFRLHFCHSLQLVSIAVMGAVPVASTLENTSFNKSAASHLHSSTNYTVAFHDFHFHLRAGRMSSFLRPFLRSSTTECHCELRAVACHYHTLACSENIKFLAFCAFLANDYIFQSIQH